MALEHIERRAARMKARREELDLTQEQVAERMQDIHAERNPGKPPDKTRGQMVSDWERAVNEPSGPKLELLALALDWTVADLSADPAAADDNDLMGALSAQTGESDAAERTPVEKLDAILNQQAELLAMFSEVRDEQVRLRKLLSHDERDAADSHK